MPLGHDCPHVIADPDSMGSEPGGSRLAIPSWRTLALVLRFLRKMKKNSSGSAVKYQRQIGSDEVTTSPVTVIPLRNRRSENRWPTAIKRPTLVKVRRQLTVGRSNKGVSKGRHDVNDALVPKLSPL